MGGQRPSDAPRATELGLQRGLPASAYQTLSLSLSLLLFLTMRHFKLSKTVSSGAPAIFPESELFLNIHGYEKKKKKKNSEVLSDRSPCGAEMATVTCLVPCRHSMAVEQT